MTAKQLTLRIELRDTDPPVWRRVEVPGEFSLASLHTVIQGAMGWRTTHFHCFEIAGKRYDMPDGDDFDWGMPRLDEAKHRLDKVLRKGQRFVYLYDFGDDWYHDVAVEAVETVRDAEPGDLLPCCTAGERACPPEDCGGPFGYADLVDVLADPAHPDHAEAAEWTGWFDPAVFSVPQANSLVYALLALDTARAARVAD